MIYKILIKTTSDTYKFAQQNVEVMEKQIVTVDGVDTIEEIGTGKFVLADYETESVDELKEKYIELMSKYRQDQLNCIADVSEKVTITVDIIENSTTNSEETSSGDVDEV